MFGEWNDEEWCQFDNYMIRCLQNYLDSGLQKSKFVNLEIRQLSAETSHDFIEWCGLLDSNSVNDSLKVETRLYKHDLYLDFVSEYPDYAPKSKLTISRTRFYKWLVSYALYKEGVQPEEGRDASGRWIVIKENKELEPKQSTIDF